MLWFFILVDVLILATAIMVSLAAIFMYQKQICVTDNQFICWADWQCNHDPSNLAQTTLYSASDTNYTLLTHFVPYSNKCLFKNSGTGNCNCDTSLFDGSLQLPNPYVTNSEPQNVYSSNNQDLCNDSVYPDGTMS